MTLRDALNSGTVGGTHPEAPMARTAKVWFRKQDGYFYTTVRGEKIKLSKDKKEATKAFHTLLAHDEVPEPHGDARGGVAAVVAHGGALRLLQIVAQLDNLGPRTRDINRSAQQH